MANEGTGGIFAVSLLVGIGVFFFGCFETIPGFHRGIGPAAAAGIISAIFVFEFLFLTNISPAVGIFSLLGLAFCGVIIYFILCFIGGDVTIHADDFVTLKNGQTVSVSSPEFMSLHDRSVVEFQNEHVMLYDSDFEDLSVGNAAHDNERVARRFPFAENTIGILLDPSEAVGLPFRDHPYFWGFGIVIICLILGRMACRD